MLSVSGQTSRERERERRLSQMSSISLMCVPLVGTMNKFYNVNIRSIISSRPRWHTRNQSNCVLCVCVAIKEWVTLGESITFHFSGWMTLNYSMLQASRCLEYLQSSSRSQQAQWPGQEGTAHYDVVAIVSMATSEPTHWHPHKHTLQYI